MNEETYAILDFKATVMHSFYAGLDPDYNTTETGKKINTVGYFLKTYIDMYINPITAQGIRLNHIVVVKDGGQVFRSILEPNYKATRGKDTDEEVKIRVRECLEAAEELFKALGIPLVQVDGVEADDVIAYLCHNLKNYVKQVYTVDQDLIQLAVPELSTLVFLKGNPTKTMTLKSGSTPLCEILPRHVALCEILPRHVALCKSIVGDTSDNYGGVKGVGGVGFKSLLDLYGEDGLDELVKIVNDSNWTELAQYATQDKVLAKLLANKFEWRKGWQLACLNPTLVGEKQGNKFNLLRWTKRLPSKERVASLLRQHRAEYLVEKVKHLLPIQTLVTADSLLKTPDLLERLKKQFVESPYISLDWETSDELKSQRFKEAVNGREYIDMLSSTITGAGFTFGNNLQYTCYFSFDHADTNNLPRKTLTFILSLIPKNKEIVAQNAYFELVTLRANSKSFVQRFTNIVDTKVMGSYVDENLPNGLKESAAEYLDYKQIKYSDVIEKGKSMKDYSAHHVFKYGADDPLVTAHLRDFYQLVMELEGTWDFCKENEFAVVEQLAESFIDGVSLDEVELEKQNQEDQAKQTESMVRLRELLKYNQTNESISSGVERLVEEFSPLTLAKGKSLDDLREDLMADVTYAAYVTEEVDGAFEMTPSAMKKVCTLLSIGDCFATSEVFLRDYLINYRGEDEKVTQFLRLAIAAAPYSVPKLRDHPDYQTFKRFVLDNILEKKPVSSGSELNMGSPKQMQVLLYGMLDLPIRIRSFQLSESQEKLGLTLPSAQANKDAIETALAEDTIEGDWKREALQCIRSAKEANTRLSMFYSVYPLWVHPYDGLIHPQLNSCGTETRRPSGSSPNFLQLPKRGDGVKFRRCILPNKKLEHDLVVSIDWSQQELRIGAALSRDKAMLDCFIGSNVVHAISPYVRGLLGEELYQELIQTETKDMHTMTAAGMAKIDYETAARLQAEGDKKFKNIRGKAKNVNFGGAYDIGKTKLARQLIIPAEEAKQYLADKKTLYFDFENWRHETIETAHRQGFIQTAFGNRRHVFKEILSKDDSVRSHCERSLVNSQIQALCSDNLKKVIRTVRDDGVLNRTGASLIAPIYDELVFSVHSDHVAELIMVVHEIMTRDIPNMCVPMLAEPSLGINFGDQIEIGAFPNHDLIMKAVAEAKRV